MRHHKRTSLFIALASAMTLIASQAAAQDNKKEDAETLDAIVVTGIRAGIEGAIAAKRDASSIIEAISAEDIGKLPDVSIAESIARLPGLAAQRVAGRAPRPAQPDGVLQAPATPRHRGGDLQNRLEVTRAVSTRRQPAQPKIKGLRL